jgi:hypothetical protein
MANMKLGMSNRKSTSLPGAAPKRRALLTSIPMKITNRRVGRPLISIETVVDWTPLTLGFQEFNGIPPDKGKS